MSLLKATASLVVVALLLFGLLQCAYSHELHQNGQRVDYKNWVNQIDKGCCNNQDCRPAKDDEVKYSPIAQVKIDGAWCPVKPEHYLKKGNAPDWSSAHLCIQMLYADDEGRTIAPVDPCSRLLCFQPHPLN